MALKLSTWSISLVFLLVVGTTTTIVYASTLSKEAPPPPTLSVGGAAINLTGDAADIDISIDPTDDLPANGTQTITTTGATDMDINEFPPLGVSVLIQNESVTVTNHSVTVEDSLLDEEIDVQDEESTDDDE